MPKPRVKVTSRPTFRDLAGRFSRANDALLEERRHAMRDAGQKLVKEAQEKLDAKLGQRHGMREAIRFNTRKTGDTLSLSVTGPEKAKPHRIAARNALALSFFWDRVGMRTVVPRRGGFKTHVRGGVYWIGKGYVDHPGGSLAPLFQPILNRTLDEWMRTDGERTLRRISTRWTTEATKP